MEKSQMEERRAMGNLEKVRREALAGARARGLSRRLATLGLAALASVVVLGLGAGTAAGSKQIVNFFGTESGSGTLGGEFTNPSRGIAVNESGAGPAGRGDVYAVDGENNRIERFARNDSGTPAEPADDTYDFVSAWGAGVDAASGGNGYQICTVASQCRPGIGAADGNGAIGNSGYLGEGRGNRTASGIAVDQDTGNVYLSDPANFRVNVYEGDGAFLRSFGYDVVASGPGKLPAPSERQQLTVKASGGRFSLSFEGKSTGARGSGTRVQGSSIIGSVVTDEGTFAIGQGISGWGVRPGTVITGIGAGSITLSQPATEFVGNEPLYADNFAPGATAIEIEAALNSLPSIGGAGGSVTVSGGPGDAAGSAPYTIEFGGSLAEEDVPPIAATLGGLIGPQMVRLNNATGGSFRLRWPSGAPYTAPIAFDATAAAVQSALSALSAIGAGNVAVTGPTGGPWEVQLSPDVIASVSPLDRPLLLADASGLSGASPSARVTAPASISPLVEGGAYEICESAAGDVCKAARAGGRVGEVGIGGGRAVETAPAIAVSQPDGNPGTGTVFLADAGNHRVGTYRLDGTSPGSFGESIFSTPDKSSSSQPQQIAVDSRGIVYATNEVAGNPRIERYDSENADGAGAGFLAPIPAPPSSTNSFARLAVDPDSDGAGPDANVLYVLGEGQKVKQFGPLNPPGLSTPPTAADDEHGSKINSSGGLAVDEADGRLYITSGSGGGQDAAGVYVLDNPSAPPTATLDSLSDVTSTGVTAHATINPNGPPALSYHLEYSLDGSTWKSAPGVVLGSQKSPQSVSAVLEPPGGLEPETAYQVRLVAKRPLLAAIVTPALTFSTLPAPPLAETTGSPVRTASTARLDARVVPRGSATTYRFEYGDQGPCETNPCTATESRAAGAGTETALVSQQIDGLAAGTVYHYRVIADNGNPGSPVAGEDMTLTTRASDEPLSHGHLPGPPGSDRAWEQVNMPDTGGNPVNAAVGFSASGERALFRIAGGTPDSETGSLFSIFFSERTASGWKTKQITPPRRELVSADWDWLGTVATDALSAVVSANTEFTKNEAIVWGMDPAGAPAKLFEPAGVQEYKGRIGLSADGSKAIALIRGSADPAYPEATREGLYDVSVSPPRLISVLPSGGACPSVDVPPAQVSHWVSADGSFAFFGCARDLYLREIGAEQTRALSIPISGPDCGARFVKDTARGAFFVTQSRLATQDSRPQSCGGDPTAAADVYRYDVSTGALECVTCSVPGGTANVDTAAIPDDGPRAYFTTATRLLAGAPQDGQSGAYRLDLDSGKLVYVAPIKDVAEGYNSVHGDPAKGNRGGTAITPDGAALAFYSADPRLNAIGGQQNGASAQYYLYDDRDRSLACVSCPQDGSAALGAAVAPSGGAGEGPNQTPLARDGRTFAFATPTPLAGADQNTAGAGQKANVGTDVYEWRGGRQLLVSDGLNSWPVAGESLNVGGVSASGRDVFFFAPAQYTADALDGYRRLYDARIGGGFEFPAPPKPCPLEVCQGTPKGAPEEAAPATATFAGPGNAQVRQQRKKKHHKKRHRQKAKTKAHRYHKPNQPRRAAR
jgi:hypothetical protein